MRLELSQFGGMAPKINDASLSEGLAEFANNVRFDTGALQASRLFLSTTPFYSDTVIGGQLVRSAVRMFGDGTRFAFRLSQASQAFPSPVSPVDTWGRVYYMTPNGPSFTTSDNYSPGYLNVNPVDYRLGVGYDESSPSATRTSFVVPVGEDADTVSVAYAYSFFDRYGHEGALSKASAPVQLAYNATFSVSVSTTASIPGRTNFEGGGRRLYRATFDGANSVWQYIGDYPLTNAMVDNVPIGDEGEQSISDNWYPAPDTLEHLCLVASSYAAGSIENHVCFSELKLPHAWPFELQYPVKYNPVKLMPLGNDLIVLTDGRPYICRGADPYSATPQEFPIDAPCIAPESAVAMDGYVMYLSNEGIVAVGDGTAELLSGSYVDREWMNDNVAADAKAFRYRNQYVFSVAGDKWMSFSPANGFAFAQFNYDPSDVASVSYSVRDNEYYFALYSGGIRTVTYDTSAAGTAWTSKSFTTPPASFSFLRVEADVYPVEVEVYSQYSGGQWQQTGVMSVPSVHGTRLPSMVGDLWKVSIKPATGGVVRRVVLAQSGKELVNG